MDSKSALMALGTRPLGMESFPVISVLEIIAKLLSSLYKNGESSPMI